MDVFVTRLRYQKIDTPFISTTFTLVEHKFTLGGGTRDSGGIYE